MKHLYQIQCPSCTYEIMLNKGNTVLDLKKKIEQQNNEFKVANQIILNNNQKLSDDIVINKSMNNIEMMLTNSEKNDEFISVEIAFSLKNKVSIMKIKRKMTVIEVIKKYLMELEEIPEKESDIISEFLFLKTSIKMDDNDNFIDMADGTQLKLELKQSISKVSEFLEKINPLLKEMIERVGIPRNKNDEIQKDNIVDANNMFNYSFKKWSPRIKSIVNQPGSVSGVLPEYNLFWIANSLNIFFVSENSDIITFTLPSMPIFVFSCCNEFDSYIIVAHSRHITVFKYSNNKIDLSFKKIFQVPIVITYGCDKFVGTSDGRLYYYTIDSSSFNIFPADSPRINSPIKSIKVTSDQKYVYTLSYNSKNDSNNSIISGYIKTEDSHYKFIDNYILTNIIDIFIFSDNIFALKDSGVFYVLSIIPKEKLFYGKSVLLVAKNNFVDAYEINNYTDLRDPKKILLPLLCRKDSLKQLDVKNKIYIVPNDSSDKLFDPTKSIIDQFTNTNEISSKPMGFLSNGKSLLNINEKSSQVFHKNRIFVIKNKTEITENGMLISFGSFPFFNEPGKDTLEKKLGYKNMKNICWCSTGILSYVTDNHVFLSITGKITKTCIVPLIGKFKAFSILQNQDTLPSIYTYTSEGFFVFNEKLIPAPLELNDENINTKINDELVWKNDFTNYIYKLSLKLLPIWNFYLEDTQDNHFCNISLSELVEKLDDPSVRFYPFIFILWNLYYLINVIENKRKVKDQQIEFDIEKYIKNKTVSNLFTKDADSFQELVDKLTPNNIKSQSSFKTNKNSATSQFQEDKNIMFNSQNNIYKKFIYSKNEAKSPFIEWSQNSVFRHERGSPEIVTKIQKYDDK